MAVSVVEVVSSQTSADPGFLSVSFAATPLAGDRALVFVTFDDTVTESSQVAMSGLGATWRLVAEGKASNTGQWLGTYEATGLDGISSTVTATESYTGALTRFGVSAFLLRGTMGTSPFYITNSGYHSSNPPVLSHTPLAANDLVLGLWLQASITAPTITTSPGAGWTTGVQNVNGVSMQWRYIIAADTSAHTMDSNISAQYITIGATSTTGSARVGSALTEAMTEDSTVQRTVAAMSMEVIAAEDTERRLARITADTMVASDSRTLTRVYAEVMLERRHFVGWGVPI